MDKASAVDAWPGFVRVKSPSEPGLSAALQEVKTWNVKVLTLNRANRYEDAAVALQFWDALDDFITRSARLRETLKF